VAVHAPAPDRRRPGPTRSSRDDADVRITDNAGDNETPAPQAGPKPPIRVDAGVPPIAPPTPATPTPVVSAPKATLIVSPNAVTKVSGEIPTMRVDGITEKFADVQSKVCINDRGQVTSVKIIKALPEISDELSRTLSTWRYQPYTNGSGQLSAVCFPLSFRVVFKRAS
jgi:hypothetical protein